MASVASSGTSPLSGYDVLPGESNEQEEMWTFLPHQGSSTASSVGFFPSPASGSLQSWGIVGHTGHIEPSPPAPSPLYLDPEQQQPPLFPASTFGEQAAPFSVTSAPAETANFGTGQDGSAASFLTQDLFFSEQELNELPFLNGFSTNVPLAGFESLGQPLQAPLQQPLQHAELEIPQSMQAGPNVSPWNPTNLKAEHIFVMEDFSSPSPPQQQHPSPSVSPAQSASPLSPPIKQEERSPKNTTPIAIRKVRGAGARVEKKKASSDSSSSVSSSAGSSKFLIVTPDSVHAHAGRPNPFECFEAMRPSQRGRKGPLANETKESALQVRRLGACFCCHARKVKCDKERPCKNCKKLCTQVPQVVCWQFQDFLTVLFPDFIRGHFRKEEMHKFITENIEGFKVDGAEKPCEVALFSGGRFSATLTIKAKFFTARTPDVLQHWHMNVAKNVMDLQSRGSTPIGLEIEGSAQRDDLRKKAREYIQQILQEPAYAEQVTDSLKHTDLPKKILQIVHNYSRQTDSTIVKKALSIYTMHYVMTRHLCLTHNTIINLRGTKLVPQNVPWVTPRVLNRQVKAIIDELLQREMQTLFDAFSKALKPKSRREWAPCLAAFLVLCLFMESVETAADTFVVSQNEIDMRNRHAPQYRRSFALRLNREVEGLPFRQFAFQFHQIYLTHCRDVAAGRSFNPLIDDTALDQAELDPPAALMVALLRPLIRDPANWAELDYLSADPILPNLEDHPYPRDVSFNYTGRLVAKFLLSFTDEKYIFGPNT